MRTVVDLAQALRIDVAVHLRRRERAVAEQLLDRAQVGAALEQVRREGVAEAVRVRQQAAQGARVEAAAACREEERVLGAADELRSRLAQVERDPVRRLFAERDDALLPALSRARGRAPARSRRPRGSGRPLPGSAGRPSRRAPSRPGYGGRVGRYRRERRARRRRHRSEARREGAAASGARTTRPGHAPARARGAGTRERPRASARSSKARASSAARARARRCSRRGRARRPRRGASLGARATRRTRSRRRGRRAASPPQAQGFRGTAPARPSRGALRREGG